MKFSIGNYYTLKLTSGEELTTRVVAQHDQAIEINQPISMVLSPQGLQMVPSLFSADPECTVTINIHSIMMSAEPREDVRQKYQEATTGIVTPPSRQILTG